MHVLQSATDTFADPDSAAAANAAPALAFIETHLFEPLTVEMIARHCGASAFRFSRRFTERHGESVMAYVRGRRLDHAARRLAANPAEDLAQLAFDTGFETQAAFTRAFTRAFGQAPGSFRRAAHPPARKKRLRMTPELVERIEAEGPIRLAGLTGHFDPSTYLEVATLWKRFVPQMGFAGQLGGGETVGAFRSRNPVARSFEHMACVRIAPDASPPTSLDVWELSAQTWLKVRQPMTTDQLHVQVSAAEQAIRLDMLPKLAREIADGADLQIYSPRFQTAPGSWIEHWIPLAD